MASLARRVHQILSNGGTEEQLICNVYDKYIWFEIHSSEILGALSMAGKSLKLQDRVIDPDLIGAHYFCAGGAMALKIMGYDESTIKNFGHWTSDTWMMYTHSQISE